MTPLGQKEVEHRIIRSLPYRKTILDINAIFVTCCGNRYPKTVLKLKKEEENITVPGANKTHRYGTGTAHTYC
jgi:hypothetical protein